MGGDKKPKNLYDKSHGGTDTQKKKRMHSFEKFKNVELWRHMRERERTESEEERERELNENTCFKFQQR